MTKLIVAHSLDSNFYSTIGVVMRQMIVVLLFACRLIHGEVVSPDLPVFLDEVSKVCGDRWNITVDERNNIYIVSNEKALGKAPGYNYPTDEDHYALYFHFRIVDPSDAKAAEQAVSELKDLRKKADKVEHKNQMGHYLYTPKSAEEWALVLSIRRAEGKVADIPTHRFKSAYLAEQSSMDFFIPNKADKNAVQYKSDITKFYALLEKTGKYQGK